MRKTGLLEDEAEEEEEEEHVRGLGDFGFGVPSTTRKPGGADEEEGHDDLNEDDLKVPIVPSRAWEPCFPLMFRWVLVGDRRQRLGRRRG